MSLKISEISLVNIDKIQVVSRVSSQSAGRKFEIIESDSQKSSLCTMNNLYLRAVELYKETNSVEDLKKLDDFIVRLMVAEDAGIGDYKKKDLLYKFRTLFHQLLGGSFRGKHTNRLRKLLNGVEQKSQRLVFTEKAYQAPAKPKNFEGQLMSSADFLALLENHRAILDQDGMGTHGFAFENLYKAFKHGKGNTAIDGNVPFFTDQTKNQEFQLKIREVMTLISQLKEVDQQNYMRTLAGAFRACNAGRVHTIQQISDTLLSNHASPDFEGRVQLLFNQYKIAVFDQMIREIRSRAQGRSISFQIPHLTSGYLAAVGEEIGLNGFEEAKTDKHKFRVDTPHKDAFIRRFKARLGRQLDDIANDLLREINNPNSDFHPIEGRGFGAWLSGKVLNNELPQDFAYYVEGKDYSGLEPATEDQEDNMAFYISKDEVMQILKLQDYL